MAQKVFDEMPSDEPEFKPITKEDYQKYLRGREAAEELFGEKNMPKRLEPPSEAKWRNKYIQRSDQSTEESNQDLGTKAGLSKLIKEKGWNVSELREKIDKESD